MGITTSALDDAYLSLSFVLHDDEDVVMKKGNNLNPFPFHECELKFNLLIKYAFLCLSEGECIMISRLVVSTVYNDVS